MKYSLIFPMQIAFATLGLFHDVTSSAEPLVELTAYAAPACAGIGGGGFGSKTYKLPLEECIDFEGEVSSYKLNVAENCQQGQTPDVLIFSFPGCKNVLRVEKPNDQNNDQCYGFGPPVQSARFFCGGEDTGLSEPELKIK